MTRFEEDSAVRPLGGGRWAATVTGAWSAPPGPNGGYVAAIVLRAMDAEVGGGRPARSLTLHYLRPVAPGDAEVQVTIERSGRSLTTATARLEQGGRPCVLAIGAFATDYESPAEYSDPPPRAERGVLAVPTDRPEVPIARRFATAHTVGPALFSGAGEAVSGGWIAFADGPQEIDAFALALLTDAWMPVAWTRLETFLKAPTIDLTIHFRAPEARPAEPVLGVWRSRAAHGGYFEEDGELWSADGVLLAQSRQLALLLP